MCGIAGIFNYAEPDCSVDRELLVRMTRVLEHRGPDDEGFYVNGPIGFGHRRLTIVDLTPTGHQPMPNTDRSSWITYNGEFYNHAAFRRRLLSAGHVFRGTSDTETLLHLIAEAGPDALHDVSGIFAFGYWDVRRQELTLARDQLGVKQLYYYDDGRRLIFASEIKALLQCADVPRELDAEALNQYLHFHTPLFDRTFFKHIEQVRAGEYLQVSRAGSRRKIYWQVEDFQPLNVSVQEQVAELRAKLLDVVCDQLMSDVPVGAFFSGGIDSSAVAAMASRTGKKPVCFGVHFTDQGVVDERPYQEAAAKALGLELHLITLDGSTFPEDLMRLIYYQDEPVIGAAMFPMYVVSRLAAKQVKVCLGGQAADEIFGGYARYGLARPWQVAKSWFSGRQSVQAHAAGANGGSTNIGGNLWLQIADRQNIRRLADNVSNIGTWQTRYFEHFAKVPESDWNGIFQSDGMVSRDRCYEMFLRVVKASPAVDAADKVMHWDLQTYLTGLFHQDDRMSMACSLESRVPLADPRLVQFAFRSGFDLKFRAGATKWLLRQAVADVLPEVVLNRRKIGFDTPAEMWMKGPHNQFVRDLLLSSTTRQRGIWNTKKLTAWLDQPNHPRWFDVIWKAMCIEAWAATFLNQQSPVGISNDDMAVDRFEPLSEGRSMRDAVQEIRELGVGGTIFRAAWEVKLRTGLGELIERPPEQLPQLNGKIARQNGSRAIKNDAARNRRAAVSELSSATAQIERVLGFGHPKEVVAAVRERIPAEDLAGLQRIAFDAVHGRIICFGSWTADFGRPINWHVNPLNGKTWNVSEHWSRALRTEEVGDIKLTWEAARFPHAYAIARAAAFAPEYAAPLSEALADQIEHFISENPFGRGVHWNSGQEIAFRLMAWMFSVNLLTHLGESMDVTADAMLHSAYEGALHIERNLNYAQKAVYNNHLLSEALALYLIGHLLPNAAESKRWREKGHTILENEAVRQCYSDGGYIQQSHNYHRVALQIYLWAWNLTGRAREPVPDSWKSAMERSLDFLVAQQNPNDGRLPNYGANDGALPSVLTTCDFSDFRPVLQALSVAARGERIYDEGPWDEATAWLLGPEALTSAPLRKPLRKSVSFSHTGYHVLRGHNSENFGVLRCGTILDRFSQIDMLHLDVWWRGQNVLVDGGSYSYNGPEKWHSHFANSASHNTIQIDGNDQMLHYRRFKNLYWTKAKTIQFTDYGDHVLCSGEHYGFQRHLGNCIHRRSVLFVKDDLWIVSDQVEGKGTHHLRQHWLCGQFPYQYDQAQARLTLETPRGQFSILTMDREGQPLEGDVVAGCEKPPRGWVSRYYGEKYPTPSLAIERTAELPSTFVSVLCAEEPRIEVRNGSWSVSIDTRRADFEITSDGLILAKSVYQS
jgi:asparagine synthase (glutamine-hydrolysing)